jgi:hypothetical protein
MRHAPPSPHRRARPQSQRGGDGAHLRHALRSRGGVPQEHHTESLSFGGAGRPPGGPLAPPHLAGTSMPGPPTTPSRAIPVFTGSGQPQPTLHRRQRAGVPRQLVRQFLDAALRMRAARLGVLPAVCRALLLPPSPPQPRAALRAAGDRHRRDRPRSHGAGAGPVQTRHRGGATVRSGSGCHDSRRAGAPPVRSGPGRPQRGEEQHQHRPGKGEAPPRRAGLTSGDLQHRVHAPSVPVEAAGIRPGMGQGAPAMATLRFATGNRGAAPAGAFPPTRVCAKAPPTRDVPVPDLLTGIRRRGTAPVTRRAPDHRTPRTTERPGLPNPRTPR